MVDLQAMGIPEVTDLFAQVNSELKEGLRDRMKQAVRQLRDAARENTSSRRMKSALTEQVSVTSLLEFSGRVYLRGKWAFLGRFIEGGTKPHKIPNFRGQEGVTFLHPGSKADPFLQPTIEEHGDEVVELVGIPPVLR